MKSNMGGTDRIIRISIAAINTKLFLNGTGTDLWGLILLLAAVFFVVTGLMGFCPVYSYLGVRTSRKKTSTN